MVAGTVAGWRRGGRVDTGLIIAVTVLRSVPVFVLGSAALFVFAVQLGWLPLSGSSTRFGAFGPAERLLDVARHLVLPAVVLALQFAAAQFLLMRAGVVAELGSEHLLAGRAKGLREATLRRRYAARNALLPVVGLLGVQAGVAVTGSVVVETVFRFEGVGRLLVDAIAFRDYPTMQGCFLLLTLLVLGANLLVELAHRRLDPRVLA